MKHDLSKNICIWCLIVKIVRNTPLCSFFLLDHSNMVLFVNFLQQEEHPSPSWFAGAAPASDDSPDDNDHTVGIVDNDEDVLGAGEASPGAAGSGSKRTVQEKEDEGNEELPGLVENDDVRNTSESEGENGRMANGKQEEGGNDPSQVTTSVPPESRYRRNISGATCTSAPI